MSDGISFTGSVDFITHLNREVENLDDKMRVALDAVLIEMANYIKEDSGNWTDRTGNLRNSINIASDESQVPSVKSSDKSISQAPLRHEAAAWVDGGKTLRGVVYAGMEYALYVELKEGHWVISGAFAHFENMILAKIARYVDEQRG
jgi:hypothetical protein